LKGGGDAITDLAVVGSDTIYGGAGKDIIFGDTINTDHLTWTGRTLPEGAGYEALVAFLTFQLGHAPSTAELYNYLKANAADFNVEGDTRGGSDKIFGGDGDDIVYGQGGNDIIFGDASSGHDIWAQAWV